MNDDIEDIVTELHEVTPVPTWPALGWEGVKEVTLFNLLEMLGIAETPAAIPHVLPSHIPAPRIGGDRASTAGLSGKLTGQILTYQRKLIRSYDAAVQRLANLVGPMKAPHSAAARAIGQQMADEWVAIADDAYWKAWDTGNSYALGFLGGESSLQPEHENVFVQARLEANEAFVRTSFVPAMLQRYTTVTDEIIKGVKSPGEEGDGGLSSRVGQYALQLWGVGSAGFGEEMHASGNNIWWEVTSGNACEDCPDLESNSPYGPDNPLPTYPGQGDTQCLSNCLCLLVVRDVVAPARVEPGAEKPATNAGHVIYQPASEAFVQKFPWLKDVKWASKTNKEKMETSFDKIFSKLDPKVAEQLITNVKFRRLDNELLAEADAKSGTITFHRGISAENKFQSLLDANYRDGWMVGDKGSLTSLVAHETGHLIEARIAALRGKLQGDGAMAILELEKLKQAGFFDRISRLAGTDKTEAFAEAFSLLYKTGLTVEQKIIAYKLESLLDQMGLMKSKTAGQIDIVPIPILKIEDVRAAITAGDVVRMVDLKPGAHANKTYKVVFTDGSAGIWKPLSGEHENLIAALGGPQWQREIAASRLADAAGMSDLLPTTAYKVHQGEAGSVQLFVKTNGEAAEVYGYSGPGTRGGKDWDTITKLDRERALSLDYVMKNIDRHLGNWMISDAPAGYGSVYKPVLIDNGLSFPVPGTHGSTTSHLKNYWGVDRYQSIPKEIKDIWHRVLGNWDAVSSQLKENGLNSSAIARAKRRIEVFLKSDTWQDALNSPTFTR